MLNRRHVAAILAATTLFSGFAIAAQSFGSGPSRHRLAAQFSESLPKHTTIRLVTGAFDPLAGVPRVTRDLAANPASTHHWLVQLAYPATKADRLAVVNAGARLVAQLPDVTYIAAASPRVAARLRHIDGVRWVGPYQPAYKLSPLLANLDGPRVRIWTHKDADTNALARTVASLPNIKVVDVRPRLVTVETTSAALPAVARHDAVAWIEPAPRYQLHNANALWTTDTGERDILGAAAPGRLDGAGQTAAVADTGINYIPDPDNKTQRAFSDCDASGCKLADYTQKDIGSTNDQLNSVTATGAHHRKMAGYFNLTDDALARSQEASWHGTHTSGSVAADYPDAAGKYGTRNREADGLAVAARLVFQDVESDGGLNGLPGGPIIGIPNDPYDLFNQVYDLNKNGKYDPNEDARTHNNSYGSIYPEFDDGGAGRADEFVVDHPDMVVVFSASNDGPDAATLAGGPQESKNIITSCASANGNQPLVSPDTVAIFSSHGPTLDGRLKPDVCTPGQIVVSPKGGTDDDDQYLQGTSMSGPVLVGLATLVRQYYWDGFGAPTGTGFATGTRDLTKRHNPSAALTKATIINSAQRMRGWYTGDDGGERQLDGQWPSAGQGWGKVQLDSALYFAGDDRSLFTVDRPSDDANGLETGTTITENIDVAPGQPLEITLVWTDPASALPAGSPVLVNDLDLVVKGPDGRTYRGNDFTTQSPVLGQPGDNTAAVNESRPNGQVPDTKNNVEGVRIATPAGGRWQIQVSGTNVLAGPQGYSLVASGRIATEQPRIVTDAAKYRPGSTATAYLLGTRLSGTIPGFERVRPDAGIYKATQTVGGALTFTGGGATLAVPVDTTGPTVSNLKVDSVSADLARVTWNTDEKSTGAVVITGADGKAKTYPDVYNVAGFTGLTTPQVETKGVYLDKPVNTTSHQVNVTGLAAGQTYSYVITSADEADNKSSTAPSTFASTDAMYQPNATDQAMLLSGDLNTSLPTNDLPSPVGGQSWGTSTQLYTGRFATNVDSVEAMPAFMFRLPKSLDPSRITAAAVEMTSAHDIVDPYLDRPVFSMDLLNSSVEGSWGPGQTYTAVNNVPADAHLASDPTLRRGAGIPYVFHVPCNQMDKFKANLANDSGTERKAAFRIKGLTDQPESLFSFEFGFGRRSRGPQLRPRLILFLDGNDPMPCTATAAPKISNVLVDHTSDTSAVVSWRTDVLSDSTVYFRKAGTTEWTPVSAPVRVTQHFVRVESLDKNGAYEFVVRSATCNGLATVDDNSGHAFALFNSAFTPPKISAVFAKKANATDETVGWTTDVASTSVVHYGTSPDALTQTATTAGTSTTHTVAIKGLTDCTRYYFSVESAAGDVVGHSPVMSFERQGGTPTVTNKYDFENGVQGFTAAPAAGNGNISDPVTGSNFGGAPTVWERRTSPENTSQGFRTVLKATGQPGYSSNVDIRLISPPVTVAAAGGSLSWKEAYSLEHGVEGIFTPLDAVNVEVSGDDGRTWTVIREVRGGNSPAYPTTTVQSADIPLTFAGKTVRVGFHFTSDSNTEPPGGGWSVDDVTVLASGCPALAAARQAPLAPVAATGDVAPVILGPVPPVGGRANGVGALPSIDSPGDLAKKVGTCRCGPIHYGPASGGGILPVTVKPPAPRVLGAGRLPATGGGLFALPALGLLGGAGGLRRLVRRRRR